MTDTETVGSMDNMSTGMAGKMKKMTIVMSGNMTGTMACNMTRNMEKMDYISETDEGKVILEDLDVTRAAGEMDNITRKPI